MLTKAHIERMPLNALVSHYLLASFCYYIRNESPMTDDAFDRLCVRLLDEWDEVDHIHKHLITEDDLRAGTCMLTQLDYPTRVQLGFEQYLRDCENGTVVREMGLDSPAPRRPAARRVATRAAAPSPAPRRVVARRAAAPAPEQEEHQSPKRPAPRRVVSRRH